MTFELLCCDVPKQEVCGAMGEFPLASVTLWSPGTTCHCHRRRISTTDTRWAVNAEWVRAVHSLFIHIYLLSRSICVRDALRNKTTGLTMQRRSRLKSSRAKFSFHFATKQWQVCCDLFPSNLPYDKSHIIHNTGDANFWSKKWTQDSFLLRSTPVTQCRVHPQEKTSACGLTGCWTTV